MHRRARFTRIHGDRMHAWRRHFQLPFREIDRPAVAARTADRLRKFDDRSVIDRDRRGIGLHIRKTRIQIDVIGPRRIELHPIGELGRDVIIVAPIQLVVGHDLHAPAVGAALPIVLRRAVGMRSVFIAAGSALLKCGIEVDADGPVHFNVSALFDDGHTVGFLQRHALFERFIRRHGQDDLIEHKPVLPAADREGMFARLGDLELPALIALPQSGFIGRRCAVDERAAVHARHIGIAARIGMAGQAIQVVCAGRIDIKLEIELRRVQIARTRVPLLAVVGKQPYAPERPYSIACGCYA